MLKTLAIGAALAGALAAPGSPAHAAAASPNDEMIISKSVCSSSYLRVSAYQLFEVVRQSKI